MADAPEQVESSRWKLVYYDGAVLKEVNLVAGETVALGRELDNDIPLDDLNISRHHARLTAHEDSVVIEDLASANGTLVNDEAITEPTTLKAGDIINLGSYAIEVQQISSRSGAKTETALPAASAVSNRRRLWPYLLIIAAIVVGVIVLLLGVLAGRWFQSTQDLSGAAPSTAAPISSEPTIIINEAPAENSNIPTNYSVTIQAIASDPSGVRRMELWVDDRLVDQVSSPVDQNAASMTAAFQWSAAAPGSYEIEVRAYNESEQMAVTNIGTVTAVGGTDTPTPVPATATPTITPLPSTPTPTATPMPTSTPLPPTATPAPAALTVEVPLLNVRSGPGTQYRQIGQLSQNDNVEIVGQASSTQGQWWLVSFAGGQTGWVSGDPVFVQVQNSVNVPVVPIPALPTPAATPTPTPTITPSPTPTLSATVIRPPSGKTLLIVSNRSLINQPARLTLSGGKSVGGGLEIDPPPNDQVEIVLEPDFYRALWSAPWKGFTRGADFTAVAGKVMVMWIVPEDGRTDTEVYDELVIRTEPTPTPVPSTPTATPRPGEPVAPPGKALFVVSNRSIENEYALLTISGGSFGGGQEIILDANTEQRLELAPGHYRTIWNSPASGGLNAGHEFSVIAGEVIYGWIIPEERRAFMQFPGQPEIQINN